MNDKPVVSVVIPVYNVEQYLEQCIESIQAQSHDDFEVICVDDGSTDHSLEILKKIQREDERIQIYSQKNAGAGAARNFGLSKAKGKYVIFLDSDDFFDSDLLKLSVERAEETEADIVAFHFYSYYQEKGSEKGVGFSRAAVKKPDGFHWRDDPNHILNNIKVVPWNKLYRTDFLRENHLQFDELYSTNDITFAALSVAKAEKIASLPKALVYYRCDNTASLSQRKEKRLKNVILAIHSLIRQMQELPYFEEISESVTYYVIHNCITALNRYVEDYACAEAREYYESIHELFGESLFENVKRDTFTNDEIFNQFFAVRRHDYEMYCRLCSRRMIVSMTSYPPRMNGIKTVLDTIYEQTHPADEVVLWLAEEQFPEGMSDLPDELQELEKEGKLIVRWCNDLKPHKKYFYAFQEYPEDLIVTIDDDLLYDRRLLAQLFSSYMMFPEAVSTVRAHWMLFDENDEILPYRQWIQEFGGLLYEPSMQLFATGGAGTLYPPHLLDTSLLDKDVIIDTCLYADDLWMKIWELLSDVPVVLARYHEELKYLPGSQDVALYHSNLTGNANDVQLEKILSWAADCGKKDIILKRLLDQKVEDSVIIRYMISDRNQARKLYNGSQSKLRTINRTLRVRNDQITKLKVEKKQLRRELRQEKRKHERDNTRWETKYNHLQSEYQELRGRFVVKVVRRLRKP